MWVTVLWLLQSVGPLAAGPAIIPSALTSFLEPIQYEGVPTLASIQKGGAWYYPTCYAGLCLLPLAFLRSGWGSRVSEDVGE